MSQVKSSHQIRLGNGKTYEFVVCRTGQVLLCTVPRNQDQNPLAMSLNGARECWRDMVRNRGGMPLKEVSYAG